MNVLFLPDYPDKEFYTIVAIFMRLGYFATRDADADFDFAMLWQDSTWVDSCEELERVAETRPVLNINCKDISKQRVEQEFVRAFAYGSFIDPWAGSGKAVKKYDENASGGYVIDLPVTEIDERFVYQKFFDTSRGNAMVEYRMPYVLGQIPLVYTEYKDIPVDRIKTGKQSIEIGEASALFSDEERAGIGNFCRGMGLDFGELDIIRDSDDGRIYILDANKTPGGFGMFNKVNWSHEQRQFAIERQAEAFDAGIRARLAAMA
jgi:hypothetical protein